MLNNSVQFRSEDSHSAIFQCSFFLLNCICCFRLYRYQNTIKILYILNQSLKYCVNSSTETKGKKYFQNSRMKLQRKKIDLIDLSNLISFFSPKKALLNNSNDKMTENVSKLMSANYSSRLYSSQSKN